ncbi:MAG TPA: TIM barrel protein [Acidimicrobiia bacterium]|jgi:sugar phosphate isomerase/epimerase
MRAVGVVDVVYWRESDPARRAELAAADGFDHIDVGTQVVDDGVALALDVGCPTAFPKPQARWCTTPAPARGDDPDAAWERTVRWWRAAPQALLEPWKGASVHSMETFLALRDEVPHVRLLVDTGHVADWGGDVMELLPYADHVQLRQGAPGRTQLHVDDPDGVIDFAAVLARLDSLDYRGAFSVEYFDLPDFGWHLDDPRGWAVDLQNAVRRLQHAG